MNEPVIRLDPGQLAAPGAVAPERMAFREGMSRVGGAVHIVATGGAAGLSGFTATAMVPVSDDPPTLLVCLNAASRSLRTIASNGAFSVNTLGSGDAALADLFAGRTGIRGAQRFDSGAWTIDEDGLPMLEGALVGFACRLVEASRVATHQVLIGEVERIAFGPVRPGLIYKGRRYHDL